MRVRVAARILSCGIVPSIRRPCPGARPPRRVITMEGKQNPRKGCAALVLITAPAPGWGSSDRAGVAASGASIRTGRSGRDSTSGLIIGCVAGLCELGEQAAEAAGDALVTVDLAVPASLPGIVGQLPLDAEAVTKPRRVLGRGGALCAGEGEGAVAGAFLGEAQAVAEFQLGLIEAGLEPGEGVLAGLPGAPGRSQRAGD